MTHAINMHTSIHLDRKECLIVFLEMVKYSKASALFPLFTTMLLRKLLQQCGVSISMLNKSQRCPSMVDRSMRIDLTMKIFKIMISIGVLKMFALLYIIECLNSFWQSFVCFC